MPTNLELKISVNSHQILKEILREINAEYKGLLNQKDVYYSVPDGLLKLRIENGDESLIFYNRNEKAKNRWSDYNLINFRDGGGEKFFSDVFRVEVVVQKKRELFIYNNTRIHLDTVKSLGRFLELETLVINGKTDARKRFRKIVQLLGINELKQIRKSYRNLLIERKKPK
jgi:adenylate cyclase, class 2